MPSPRPRAFSEALARQHLQPQCSTCGGPEAIPLTITLLYDGEELGRCEACGHKLDIDGRPVGDGQNLRVVRLVGAKRGPAVDEADSQAMGTRSRGPSLESTELPSRVRWPKWTR